jgi:putative membrane protein
MRPARLKKLLFWMVLAAPVAGWAYPDESFCTALAEKGIAEMDSGTLVQAKSPNPQVQEFAALMVKDHAALNDRLRTLLGSKRSRLPTSADAVGRAVKAKLGVLSGRLFEQFYIRSELQSNQAILDLVKGEIASGKDAKVRAFAQDILPSVETHLKTIRVLASGEGV